ncbi:MAG: hypothetical protein M9944_07850 [Rhizobiaceae bacterium]|nr:hypothetical protein [Rhizobiaceae bacterium]
MTGPLADSERAADPEVRRKVAELLLECRTAHEAANKLLLCKVAGGGNPFDDPAFVDVFNAWQAAYVDRQEQAHIDEATAWELMARLLDAAGLSYTRRDYIVRKSDLPFKIKP